MKIRRHKADASFLDAFQVLGYVEIDSRVEESHGVCIYCGSLNKFYINVERGVWDCKRCGKQGDFPRMMREYRDHCIAKYPQILKEIAVHRSLKESTIKEAGAFAGVGEDHVNYLWFPIRNIEGLIVNLRRVAIPLKNRNRTLGLPNIPNMLWGVETITRTTQIIYICEGEWDRLALIEMIENSAWAEELYSGKIVVLSQPGAGTWKFEWTPIFSGKEVVLCHDHDEPGQKGLTKIVEALTSSAKLFRINWPDTAAVGYDVRDYKIAGGTFEGLRNLIRPVGEGASKPERPIKDRTNSASFETVLDVYRRWMKLTPEHVAVLRLIYAVVLSNRLDGDPFWLQIVGAAGAGKTELLLSISAAFDVVTTSNVTPASLISGFPSASADPSLIPKVIGKTLVIKDWTEILQQPEVAKNQVYSIFRGAFDGEAKREFGNGVVRSYKGRFAVITGVTGAVDGEHDEAMGERFLKYRMRRLDSGLRRELVLAALDNVGAENEMRKEMADVAQTFLEHDPQFELHFSDAIIAEIADLAEMTAMLRTRVARDPRTRERIIHRPEPEVASRIAKQLKRALIGLSLLRKGKGVYEDDRRIMRQLAISTAIPFYVDVLAALYRHPDSDMGAICRGAKINSETLKEVLDDLMVIGVLERRTSPGGMKYVIKDEFRGSWSEVFRAN